MIKLVIFDLDGTLVDSISDIALSCNKALRKNGLSEYPMEDYKQFVGSGVKKLIERVIEKNSYDRTLIAKVFDDFMLFYKANMIEMSKPYIGIIEMLRKLRDRNIMLGVASNKFDSGTKMVVKTLFNEFEFKAVFGQRENIPPKPSAHTILEIMRICKVNNDECLYVGDSDVDMKTANNAMLRSIGVTWGFRTKQELIENGATYIVDKPNEIIDILDKHNR